MKTTAMSVVGEFLLFGFLAVTSASSALGQREPDFGQPPPVLAGRIEVRFALGEKPLRCRKFFLRAKEPGRLIISGWFSSGFTIPPGAADLPKNDTLNVEIRCGSHRWHFTEVGERAFLTGYWWVGTDYPPFQTELQSDQTKDAAWIAYLLIRPSSDSGFDVFYFCPPELKNQKPGPCARGH
jgi:hypothetical protein